MKNKKTLIICIAIPLLIGGLSSIITNSGMKDFEYVNQPPLTPPPLVFAIVWSILYILMGIALYRVYTSPVHFEKTDSILLFALQLIMNFFWSIFFFIAKAYFFSFIWLAVMIFIIIITSKKFRQIDRASYLLMIPYIVWSIFGAYLNIWVYILN